MDEDAEHISPDDPVGEFQCPREPTVESYFRRKALRAESERYSRTYVIRGDDPRIFGFYSVSMSVANSKIVPKDLKSKRLRFPIPVALLAQFGKDQRVPSGFGDRLLSDLFRRVLAVAEQVGCRGIILQARSPGLVKYYEDRGFVSLSEYEDGNPHTMFLPLELLES